MHASMDVKVQHPMFTIRGPQNAEGIPVSLAKWGWGGPHITRDMGMGVPISRGSPYRAYTGLGRFEWVWIATSFSKPAFLVPRQSLCPRTQHSLVMHMKCLVRWQELSLHRKASGDSLEPEHTQRMLWM